MNTYQNQINQFNLKSKTMEVKNESIKMEVEKILVTPEKAKNMLGVNYDNRKLKTARVKRMSDDILKGLWVENTGVFIKISVSGHLIDGQHRLHSIIKANKPIKLWICYNVNDKAKEVIDTGAVRSASDIFSIKGIKNSGMTTSMQLCNVLVKIGNSSSGFDSSLSAKELLEIYFKDSNYYQSTFLEAQRLSKTFQGIISKYELAGYIMAFDKFDRLASRSFANQLCQGVDVNNHTIILLRNRLMADKFNRRNKMSKSFKRAIIIKTFNAYAKGRALKILKYDAEKEGRIEIDI